MEQDVVINKAEAPKEPKEPKRDSLIEESEALIYKKRMLQWHNPVEFVNNMYGNHPAHDKSEYFNKIFSPTSDHE